MAPSWHSPLGVAGLRPGSMCSASPDRGRPNRQAILSLLLTTYVVWPFQRLQFTLGRKVPLGDALIIAAHKRRGSGLGQGEEFLRRFQLTTQSAVRINHDSPLAD